MQNKNRKTNSSTKAIFIYTVAFWLLGYSIALIIFLWGVNFYPSTVNYQPSDSFLSLTFRNFKDTLLYIYSPLYIIPLLLSSYLTIQWKGNKKYILPLLTLLTFTIPICLSFFLFYIFFTLLQLSSTHSIGWLWEYGYTGEVISILIAPLIQLILCLLLPIALKNQKKIILNPVLIGLSFFLVASSYITFSAKTASASPPLLEELTQKAAKTKNISYCEEIKKEGKKRKFGAWRDYYNNCTDQLAQIAVSTDDVKLCEKVIETIEYEIHRWESGPEEKLKCLGLVAAATNNPILCIGIGSCLNTIPDIPLIAGRLKCFEELFLKTSNPAICGEIKEEPSYAMNKEKDYYKIYRYRDICFYASAINLKNPILCEKLTGEDNKKICYDNINPK